MINNDNVFTFFKDVLASFKILQPNVAPNHQCLSPNICFFANIKGVQYFPSLGDPDRTLPLTLGTLSLIRIRELLCKFSQTIRQTN